MLSPSQYIRQGNNYKRGGPEKESRPVNVQVAVRCRPLNDREKTAGDRVIVKCDDKRREIIFAPPSGRKVPSGLNNGKKKYTYDHVFGPESTQSDVYDGVVKPIVDEVLQGYNCTVFAYGQTGTGKTHTMEGQRDSDTTDLADRRLPDNAGMIPRAVKQIFDYLRSLTDEHSVKVSHLELYNEQLTDLLGHESEGKDLRMYEDNTKGVFVNGLDEFVVKSEEEIFQFLDKAAMQRKTAETLMNKFSSRSHSVFSITIHIKESSPDGSELLKVGKLNLVDLAGSENIGRSGAIAKRAREAGNINQSLLTLGRVITALVEKHPHIPYRDSKLTRLLQESLGGRNKTCIIATATPGSSAYEETASTFEYAYRAKSIKNRPTVNQMIAKNVLMKDFTDEISKLKRELDHARSKKGVYLPVDQYEELMEEMEALKEKGVTDEEKHGALESKVADAQEEILELKGSLSEKEKILKSTMDKLDSTKKEHDGAKKELAEEKIISTAFKTQAADYLSKGKQLQTTLTKVIGHNDSLHARVDEHKRIEKENLLRISNLQQQLVESQAKLSASLKDYESKHQEHIKNMQTKVTEFASNANEQANDTAKSFANFREQLEQLTKESDGNHEAFEKNLVNSAASFAISCRNSWESQKVRLGSIVDHVNTETASINEHFGKLRQDVSNLGDTFKNFDAKQDSAFKDFVSSQKSKFIDASGNVSDLLTGQEKSLNGIKSQISDSREIQMAELEKMRTNVLNQVSQILADSIAQQYKISKDTVDKAVGVIDQTVTEGNATCEKTTNICAELGVDTDKFSKFMGDERTNFSNTVSKTVEETMERTDEGTEIVHVHSKGTISLLSEVKSEEEKMQMKISAHRNTMGDTIKERYGARSEENKELVNCVTNGEKSVKNIVEDIKKNIGTHESNLDGALKENLYIVNETQTNASGLVDGTIVKPVSEFKLETDQKINDAPKKEKYVYPHLLEEREEETNSNLDPTLNVQVEDNLATENKKDVAADETSSSSSKLSDEENVAPDGQEEDMTMDSISSAESTEPIKKVARTSPSTSPEVLAENDDENKSRDGVLVPGVSNKNVTISRKRKAMSKSKSKKIRRPRVLAKKSSN